MRRVILQIPDITLLMILLQSSQTAASTLFRRVVVEVLACLARARVAETSVHGARVGAD